jgi:YHS domain-containing protein
MGGVLRLLLLAIVLWLLLSSLRRLLLLLACSRRDKAEEKEAKDLPLVQDRQCGRFVLARAAVSTSFQGQALHFCSQECRDLYRRSPISEEQENRS